MRSIERCDETKLPLTQTLKNQRYFVFAYVCFIEAGCHYVMKIVRENRRIIFDGMKEKAKVESTLNKEH